MSFLVDRHVVAVCNELIHKLLEPLPYVFCWFHKDFYNEAGKLLLADGVHVNRLGQYRLYRSYRCAIWMALFLLWLSCYRPQYLYYFLDLDFRLIFIFNWTLRLEIRSNFIKTNSIVSFIYSWDVASRWYCFRLNLSSLLLNYRSKFTVFLRDLILILFHLGIQL